MARALSRPKLKLRRQAPPPVRLEVKIFSPYQIFYQGPADSVSAANRTGPFAVLPYHANFFSLLAAGDVIVDAGYQKLVFTLTRGIIRVHQNQVTVFVDI